MIEYHILRVLVALAAFLLAFRFHSVMRFYFLVYGVWNLIPALLWNEGWKRMVDAPGMSMCMVLSVLTTGYIVCGFLPLCRAECWVLMLWGCVIGMALSCAGWFWAPERWYQMIALAGQYVYLVLAAGMLAIWWYVKHMRPTETPAIVPLWVLWVLTSFLLASTAKHGLLWSVVPWKDGLIWWRAVSDLALLGKLAIAFSLQRRPRAAARAL